MKRRSYGNGSVYKRKDGRWVAQAYVTLANQEKKRISVTVKSREDARIKLREILEQKENRIAYDEEAWTVAGYFDYWMSEVQSKRIRETTMATYTMMIKNYLKPVLGRCKLQDLNVHSVRCALDMLEQRGCPGATLEKCLRILSACLSCAMREELVTRNVAQLVEKPHYTPKEAVLWTAEQTIMFLETIKAHPQYIAFLLILTYGLRRGEALGLRWSDIDFDNGQIHIRQQITRINGKIKARTLKTKNSRRTLPLMSNVHKALVEHMKKNGIAPSHFIPQCELSLTGTVVVSEAGTPLEPRNLGRCLDGLIKKAGLPRIKVHDMRHIAATNLKDLNVPAKDAQLILGHANISTTLNIYQHGTLDTQRTAISAVESRLFGGEPMLASA